jgi:hypothetical protein
MNVNWVCWMCASEQGAVGQSQGVVTITAGSGAYLVDVAHEACVKVRTKLLAYVVLVEAPSLIDRSLTLQAPLFSCTIQTSERVSHAHDRWCDHTMRVYKIAGPHVPYTVTC